MTAATLVSRAYQGDVPGVVLSGGKLVASMASSGDSIAKVLIVLDMTYANMHLIPAAT